MGATPISWTLIAAGSVGLLWLVVIFDSSLPNDDGSRTHNIGLISDREIYAALFGSMLVAGSIPRQIGKPYQLEKWLIGFVIVATVWTLFYVTNHQIKIDERAREERMRQGIR